MTGRTAWARNLASPVRDFLGAEEGGAAVLVGAAVYLVRTRPTRNKAYHPAHKSALESDSPVL